MAAETSSVTLGQDSSIDLDSDYFIGSFQKVEKILETTCIIIIASVGVSTISSICIFCRRETLTDRRSRMMELADACRNAE